MKINVLKKLDKDSLKSEISNIIYNNTKILEDLEYAGVLSGNLHHLRQKFAALAEEEVEKRFIELNKRK